MNIFVTDQSPITSAKSLDNKRVVKMILESAQMLSTAVNIHGGEGPYRTAYKNHPCTIWARESRANFEWLLAHMQALSDEYTRRYNKTHKSSLHLPSLRQDAILIPEVTQTPFEICIQDHFRPTKDPIDGYRKCLTYKWFVTDKRKPEWPFGKPEWLETYRSILEV